MNNSSIVADEKESAQFDICFLQDIHEILSRLEEGRDIENLSHKVLELKEKITQAKQVIEEAKGISNTKSEQEDILKALQQQLQIKRDIVEKYRNFKLERFDQPK